MLRIHDHAGRDLAGRLDGNPVRGHLPARDVLEQLARGRTAFLQSSPARVADQRPILTDSDGLGSVSPLHK